MRAKSSKQRFPVIEWIRKLDKLQTTAIKMSERARKRPSTPLKDVLIPSHTTLGTTRNPGSRPSPMTRPPTPLIPVPAVTIDGSPPASNPSSRRTSYANSVVSEPQAALLDLVKDRSCASPRSSRTIPDTAFRSLPRNISDTSLRSISDDNSSIDQTELRKGVIEPPPKGSKLSRKLSLGTRLGPGHLRQKHESGGTLESLSAIDEEQRVHVSDEDEEDYIYTAEAIRRQFVSTQDARNGEEIDGNDSSDQDDDHNLSGKPRRITDSVYVDEENYLVNKIRALNSDIVRTPTQHTYVGALNPSTNPTYAYMNTSHLSLASVLSGREEFALARVDDFFTDADGKYLKRYQDTLAKIDTKNSKTQLCIEEFLIKSEKEWSNVVRNKKLGLDSHHDRESKTLFAKPLQETGEEGSESQRSSSHLDSTVEEVPQKYIPPTGIKLLMQRRIGEWPVYTFLIALVRRTLNVLTCRDKLLPPILFN